MEFQVRHVGGIENCFVTLPLILIQTLESTRPPSSPLPNLLNLELRSSLLHRSWTVSWSGATSPSVIEISPQFAECISLPDGTVVGVRVVPKVESATLVSIEPVGEDDWEVMELNSKLAETEILKQVRVVHEAMKFPLWLHGRTVVTFVVVSVSPGKAVVQLEQDSEVAVAPKWRKKDKNELNASSKPASDQYTTERMLLRLQDSDSRMFHKANVNGIELGFALTSVAYMHPDTAKALSLASLQLIIIVPRSFLKESTKTRENGASRIKGTSSPKEVHSASLHGENRHCHAFVHLLFSNSVAKGHLMISQSLRLYLGAGIHKWVYVKGCDAELKEDISAISLAPCYLKPLERDQATDKNEMDVVDHYHSGNMVLTSKSGSYMDAVNAPSIFDKVVSALSYEYPCTKDEFAGHHFDGKRGLGRLLKAWVLAQLDAVASTTELDVPPLILGKETLLHFKVDRMSFSSDKKFKTETPAESTGLIGECNSNVDSTLEFSYLLSFNEASMIDKNFSAYKLTFDDDNKEGETMLAKLKLVDTVCLYYFNGRIDVRTCSSDVSSLSWMGTTASDVINRSVVLLSPEMGTRLSGLNLPLPGHILIYGPHGSGKTILAQAVAKSLEEHEDIFAHIVYVSCTGLALEKTSAIHQAVSGYISEALAHAPSLVIFDDLDSILPSPSEPEGFHSSAESVALAKFFAILIDEYAEKRKSSCGIGPIAFIATVQTLESIPHFLNSSGRFDFHVQLPAPAASERVAILKHEIKRRCLECSDEILLDVASKCDGYDAYDLETLVDRAVHAAIGRFLLSHSGSEGHEAPSLTKDDFSRAMAEFVPVAMRDVTKAAPDGGRSGWQDVGGLQEVRNAIKEMIELPSRFPDIFAQSPLRLRSNVLLYGPPGCGKTHIVGAAAAACSLRFISVKGPELLNKYIGASEQAVRDIFSKAAAAAPCILFFDEFDSIAPKRGHDNTGVTDRVVNQFLTELDGIEVLTGVFVFAATSRPDLLDAALLRPGRLDRLLFCDFPSQQERLDILAVLSRKLPMADDVDLEMVARMTDGFSGADLQALLSDAQLAAVHEHLSIADGNRAENMPIITNTLLKSIASKARSSISEAERQRLYGIYSQFLDSKRSVAAQSRDAKGKRATLA